MFLAGKKSVDEIGYENLCVQQKSLPRIFFKLMEFMWFLQPKQLTFDISQMLRFRFIMLLVTPKKYFSHAIDDLLKTAPVSFWFSPFMGCGQAHLVMPKVFPNTESPICQD